MNKILVVARNEYLISVTSKAFLIGLVMMPVFMGGAIAVQHLTRDQVDLTPRKLAVIDQTGKLRNVIEQSAELRNERQIFEDDGADRKQVQPEFLIEIVSDTEEDLSDLQIRLSDRIRQKELFAYAVIGPNTFDVSGENAIRYYSESPSYQDLPDWLQFVVNDHIRNSRIKDLGLSPENVAALDVRTRVRQFGLVQRTDDGNISDAKEENRLLTFAVPFAGLMLMFMMVMSVAPPMLNSVLEEKMQKISEFLVSSVTPFQLMLGKLVGAVAVGMTLSTVYLGAAYALSVYFEISNAIPISLYAWFVFFLFIALTIYGSVFSAVGAASSEIRDAQSLMTPIMLLVIIPMMCMGPIIQSPSSTFAKAMSMFPPATPMLMFVRIAIPPGPAYWEIIVATLLVLLFAGCCVWAGGKIFRVGILSQGQAPTFARLIHWIFTK